MNTKELRDTLDGLLAADPDCAERNALADMVASSSRLRCWLDSFDMSCARQTRRLAAAGRSEPPSSLINRNGRLSEKEAAAVTERESVGSAMGSFEGALGDGAVTAGHLDAIAAATKRLDDACRAEFAEHETELLAKAASESVDAFRRRCQRLARRLTAAAAKSDADELDSQRKNSCVKRWVDQITGMHHTHLELDPIRDAALWSVVDAEIASLRQTDGNAQLSWGQLQTDALVNAVNAGAGHPGNGNGGRRVPEITVLVDWQTLRTGLHGLSVCETENGIDLPVSTVRRMCCDAEVLPAVFGGDSEILDVGRSKRTASRAQRRALRAMYRSCVHPDCTIGFSACRIHHIRWWLEHRGPTDLDNLVPLCEQHHHLVHEGGWGLSMTADRTVCWTRPDGIVAHTTHSADRTPDKTDRKPNNTDQAPDNPHPPETPGNRKLVPT